MALVPRIKARRASFGQLPRPVNTAFPWAKDAEYLSRLSLVEQLALFIQHPAWDLMRSRCAKLDREAKGQRGPGRAYPAEVLEAVLLFGRFIGARTYKDIRNLLASDRYADVCVLLGLDAPRGGHYGKILRLTRGIPSEATMSRHRQRFTHELRRDVYEAMHLRLLEELLPLIDEQARILHMDGTVIKTRLTAPKFLSPEREYSPTFPRTVTNASAISAPEAGFVGGRDAPRAKYGHGWNLVPLCTQDAVPLSWSVIPNNGSERAAAVQTLRRYSDEVRPLHSGGRAEPWRVLVLDGGFSGNDVACSARAAGLIESVTHASTSNKEESKRNVEERNQTEWTIYGNRHWRANGHRELHCRCGKGTTAKEFGRLSTGELVLRVVGKCRRCGPVSITSGEWRNAKNPRQFVRATQGEQGDLSFGNPLTFNDPCTGRYARQRYARQEGMFAALGRRFGLNWGKRYFRSTVQVEADAAVVFSIITLLSLHQRQSEARAGTSPAALAAAPGVSATAT